MTTSSLTFAELVATLSWELGSEIAFEDDACAVRAGAGDGAPATILRHGFGERGAGTPANGNLSGFRV